MITQKVRDEVLERSRGHCENPECFLVLMGNFEVHHIYWRSQYRKSDRDDPWNLATLCVKCHYSIHSEANIKLDKYLKLSADNRKPASLRSTTKHKDFSDQKRRRKLKYRMEKEAFMLDHDGLTPGQVKYRQNKAYQASKLKLN